MFPISDSVKSRRFPIFNFVFIAINILVFIVQITTSDPEGFIKTYAFIPSLINFSDINTLYPFITSMFLHGGFLHIISNMLFLWVFGDNVEGDLPPFFYIVLYLGSGIIGSLSQYLLSPNSDIPMLGASGAVAGALGAYFALFPDHRIKTLVTLPFFFTFTTISAKFMLGYWIVLQIFSGITGLSTSSDQGGVAFFAHIGGFIFGYLIVKLFPRRNPDLQRIA